MLLSLVLPATAGAPAHLPVQARLLDAQGTPIDDPIAVTFGLYTQPVGDSPVFSEMRMVDPDNGYFSVFLGEVNPLDWSVVDGTAPVFVGITLADAPELPRQPVGTVPFAAFADRAAAAGDADTLEGLDVDGVIAEVVATYPSVLDPYADADAVAAMGAVSNANPLHHVRYSDSEAVAAMGGVSSSNSLNHGRYTDSEALSAAGSLGDGNPRHHTRYTDSEAVSAMGGASSSNPLNHGRYSDSEAVSAMGSTSNGNPLNHTRYTDASAVSAVSSADQYVRNNGDTMSGELVVPQGIRSATGVQAAFPTMLNLSRGGSTVISATTPGGSATSLDVAGATGLVSNGLLAYVPGSGGGDGRIYLNINGIPSMACTLLHAEDDGIRYGLAFATDVGNGMTSIWGNSNTRTFMLSQQGNAGLPLGINASYRILCM